MLSQRLSSRHGDDGGGSACKPGGTSMPGCASNLGDTSDAKIVAVDLQLMAPIPGVVQIHGDITKVLHAAKDVCPVVA